MRRQRVLYMACANLQVLPNPWQIEAGDVVADDSSCRPVFRAAFGTGRSLGPTLSCPAAKRYRSRHGTVAAGEFYFGSGRMTVLAATFIRLPVLVILAFGK